MIYYFSLNFPEANAGMNICVQLIIKQMLPQETYVEVEEAGQVKEEDKQLCNFRPKTYGEQDLAGLCRGKLDYN